jgi:hypothetical protein
MPFWWVLLQIPGLIATLWVTLDMLTAWNRFRKVQKYLKGDSFRIVYFKDGISTAYLGQGAKIFDKAIQSFRDDTSIPLEKRARCESLLNSGKLFAALSFAEHAREAADRAAKKAARNRELHEAESNTLLRRGSALGVPEQKMRTALEQGLASARGLIGRQEHLNQLLAAARKCGCETLVAALIDEDKDYDAQGLISHVNALVEKARTADCLYEVRARIASGSIEQAEEVLMTATKRRTYLAVITELERRIDALPRHAQVEPRRQLEVLRGCEFGTRDFRKQRHLVEEAI